MKPKSRLVNTAMLRDHYRAKEMARDLRAWRKIQRAQPAQPAETPYEAPVCDAADIDLTPAIEAAPEATEQASV